MQGATVLIVDDDPEIRSVLIAVLEDEGYVPETAANGRQAIERLTSGQQLPDAMLLDLMMSDIDGFAVLEHLRRSLLHDFPTLIVSARRPDERVLKALDSELRDFIAKPFQLEELTIRLKRLMQRSPRFASPTAGQLRVYALGSLRVYRDDALLFNESWKNKPAKTIFKLLFTNRGQRYPKDVLLEELWPEADPQLASNRLRVAVHELRKKLLEGGRNEHTHQFIVQQEGSYFFDPAAFCWADVHAFQEHVDRGHQLSQSGSTDEALQQFRKAEALYQGDYLRDDPFFEWTIATRERLREAHLSTLSEAARLHADKHDFEEAAGFCRKILRAEPWREEVYRRLMEYLVAAGRPNEALRVFEDCRRALQTEMDVGPAPATLELRDRISRQRADTDRRRTGSG